MNISFPTAIATKLAQLIGLLKATQENITEPDDPQSSYLLAAWARICKILGSDFAPYLDIVMPPLLRSAQIKPDFAILESEYNVNVFVNPSIFCMICRRFGHHSKTNHIIDISATQILIQRDSGGRCP